MDILILEASRSSASVARFRTKAKTVSFLGADRFPLTDEKSLELLCKKLADEERGNSKIALSLPPASLCYREMELPLRDRRKIRDILPLELKGETAVDTEESLFDSIPLDGGKFLVVWGKRKEISESLECMTGADLEPQIITSAPLHWQSLLPGVAGECVALSDGTALSVYNHGRLVYFRALGGGETRLEMERTLAALECGKGIKVEHLFLFGEAAGACAGSQPQTAGEGIPRSPLPVTGRLAESFAANRTAAITWAGAWALADEIVSGSPVNFRYGDLAYTAGFEKAKAKLRISAMLAAACVIFLFTEAGIRYSMVKKDLDSLNNSIRAVYHEVFPTRTKAVDELAELKSEIKRMGGYAGTQNLLNAMKKITEIKGDTISGFYESEFEANQVRLKGDADSFQAVNDFRTRAGSLFATAEVGEIKSRPGGGVSFSFRGTLQEANK
jgi:general secretion pathway protein L